MKQVTYSRAALKTLKRMPANWSKRIRDKVNQYAADPASLEQNVTELKGRSGLRLRVGDWRVIMDDEGTVLAVLEIASRGSAYG